MGTIASLTSGLPAGLSVCVNICQANISQFHYVPVPGLCTVSHLRGTVYEETPVEKGPSRGYYGCRQYRGSQGWLCSLHVFEVSGVLTH
jgi:hypothetical protein